MRCDYLQTRWFTDIRQRVTRQQSGGGDLLGADQSMFFAESPDQEHVAAWLPAIREGQHLGDEIQLGIRRPQSEDSIVTNGRGKGVTGAFGPIRGVSGRYGVEVGVENDRGGSGVAPLNRSEQVYLFSALGGGRDQPGVDSERREEFPRAHIGDAARSFTGHTPASNKPLAPRKYAIIHLPTARGSVAPPPLVQL